MVTSTMGGPSVDVHPNHDSAKCIRNRHLHPTSHRQWAGVRTIASIGSTRYIAASDDQRLRPLHMADEQMLKWWEKLQFSYRMWKANYGAAQAFQDAAESITTSVAWIDGGDPEMAASRLVSLSLQLRSKSTELITKEEIR